MLCFMSLLINPSKYKHQKRIKKHSQRVYLTRRWHKSKRTAIITKDSEMRQIPWPFGRICTSKALRL